jgi:hypothetical protein
MLIIIGFIVFIELSDASQIDKRFDLGFLGKLVLHSESNVITTDATHFRPYSTKISFRLQYELDDVRVPTLAKVDIQGSILALKDGQQLGCFEITFEGLLLKGISQYLSTSKAKAELENQGIKLIVDDDNDNKVTLSRVIPVPAEKKSLLGKFQTVDSMLRDYQQEIRALESVPNPARESQLKELLKSAVAKKNEIFIQLINDLEFPCAPEFKEVITFPIWEIGGSATSGNASAKARAGVSGDVQIKITAPTCGLSAAPLFKNQTWTRASKTGL